MTSNVVGASRIDREYLELLQTVDLRIMLEDLIKNSANEDNQFPSVHSIQERSKLIDLILRLETQAEKHHAEEKNQAVHQAHRIKVLMCTG